MIQLLDMEATSKVHFDLEDELEASSRVQFHVVGTRNFLSSKLRGKRPSNAFVGMRVTGDLPKEKGYHATSTVKCRNSEEPEWSDNLGPMWLSPLASVSFHVKSRSTFSKSTKILASTDPFSLRKLMKMQGSTDRRSTIALPLRSQTDVPTDGVIIVNIRLLSTSSSGMTECLSLKSAGSQRSSMEDELIRPTSPLSATFSGKLSLLPTLSEERHSE